jgi:hypothetical protein
MVAEAKIAAVARVLKEERSGGMDGDREGRPVYSGWRIAFIGNRRITVLSSPREPLCPLKMITYLLHAGS